MRRQLWMTLAFAASVVPGLSAAHDAYDAMRLRWQTRLVGPAALDRSAPDVAAKLSAESDAAQGMLERMHAVPAEALWDDIADFHNANGILASAAVTSNARRLAQLAQAYATPGARSYRDPRLAQALVTGLDWLLEEHYAAGRPAIGNWWDWQIGTPLLLLNALNLAHDAVPAELRQRCLAAINWYAPDPRYRARRDGTLSTELETGANLLDKSLVAILAGVLGKDGRRIAAGRDAIGASLEYVEKGDGFYRDGSFIQHGNVAYTGSYGVVALADYARLLYLLAGSDWPITDPRAARIFLWARDSYVPMIIDGAMPDAFRGRKIASREHSDHRTGRGLVGALALLAEQAPAADAAALRAAIKGWMQRDRTFGNDYLTASGATGVADLPLFELGLLKAIAADPAVVPAAEEQGARIFASMDRAVLRGPGFGAVLSLTSPRTSAFEAGNGENLQGWWTGMGMLALYDADQVQFGPNFWATIDSQRLPGTTTDGSGRGRPAEWTQFPNTEAWVGGASLGKYAAVGMAFSLSKITGSQLKGRKSWFLLGDRILALGSGIGGGQGPAETIVENRRLSDAAGARLLVDGKPLANGGMARAHWAHLQDDKSGSHIGYVFPQGSPLQAVRGERTGSWRNVHEHAGAQEARDSYQLLSIPHGSPQYAYLLLPNASEASTRAAAADSSLHIEANDEQSAAVYLPQKGIYAANLWRAGSAPRAGKTYVSSSAPAAVVIESTPQRLRLVVAEPTQQEPSLELVLSQPVGALLTASAGVTVLQTAPQLRLRIDAARAAGSGFQAEFAVRRP